MQSGFKPGVILFGLIALRVASDSAQAAQRIGFDLIKIDEGKAWVSSYWGSNGPKLIHDGEAFYTVALWGEEQRTSRGAVYKLQDGSWIKGYEWDGLNYQPGMILLDGQKRIILVHPRMSESPVVMRSLVPRDFRNFELLPRCERIRRAGYMGAAIYGQKLVMGFVGDPQSYSFAMAVLDLASGAWEGPWVLAPGQLETKPNTIWLYPVIWPTSGGVHLVVDNANERGVYKHKTYYAFQPWDELDQAPQAELVAEVDPWQGRSCRSGSMWVDENGTVFVPVNYQPGDEATKGLYVFRRDPGTNEWSHSDQVSESRGAAIYRRPGDTDQLWLITGGGDSLRLYASSGEGRNWSKSPLDSFEVYGLRHATFLHRMTAASGSVVPGDPCVVFAAGKAPNYQMWFARLRTPPRVEASEERR